ncbi:MAG: 5-histidylcysteine sulfoxide synthase [Candidatus Cloacimonetes bacterium]|nr:5-histidylcysteine sulfoxide synthase [Candidatus Cloacimonadota bacterium]
MMEELKKQKTLILNDKDANALREKVRRYFHATYSIDEKLYELLADDAAFYLRPDPLRHPLVFYLGHTAVFYINKLNIAGIISERINPAFESMFAVGVDEMSWDDLNEAHYDWPAIPRVREYRDKVRNFVDDLISKLPAPEGGITWDSPWWAVIMGIEHERIHLETSSVLIRQMPLQRVRSMDFWNICEDSGTAPQNELLPVKGKEIVLGKDYSDPLYGWDNEYGKKSYYVQDFQASRFLVSNAEYRQFIDAGGYNAQEYWTPEGWAWKSYEKAKHPRFWAMGEEGEYFLRTIAALVPMPWNHPVEVNYLEAKAFCNWKAKMTGLPIRMPTEAEWYAIRDGHLDTDLPYWDKAPGNINLEYWASACPVDRFAFGEFYDIIGNVWQWTETPIAAFPGFKIHPYYDDFSVPTFDTRHNLIKGGSFISTGNEAIRDSRYAFRRHFYQHAGFRYISSPALVEAEDNLYEDDPSIVPFCDLDWGSDFALWLIDSFRDLLPDQMGGNALNLGCKTGRVSFELARYFAHVSGLDSTARIIQLAARIKEEGFIRYIEQEEGEITAIAEHSLKEKELQDYAARVEFWQADSSNLAPKYDGYDFVLALNTLEETIDPSRFLSIIPERMKSGAYLVIADAYLFKAANPPAGIRKAGEPYRSWDWLKESLGADFELVTEPKDVWQPLRQSKRLYHSRLLQVSVWRKKH